MKYTVDESLSNFKFWAGGKDRADLLSASQLDELDDILSAEWADQEVSDTQINDLFWFEFEWVCSLLGLKYAEDANVYDKDDWAEHVEEVVKQYCLNGDKYELVEIYLDEFLEDDGLWDLNSDAEIREAFDEYVSDNWLDHAYEVLLQEFPDSDALDREEFADEYWQNCASDERNCSEFKKWLEENK